MVHPDFVEVLGALKFMETVKIVEIFGKIKGNVFRSNR